MTVGHIEVAQDRLVEFCRRNGVRKLALFGAVLTDHFSDASDIDVLVEFEPGQRVGYLRMAGMERELSAIFGGRKVDLRTPNELSRYFRDEVLRTAVVQYAAE
jgi:predicted nucleotidyltransferase